MKNIGRNAITRIAGDWKATAAATAPREAARL
jgi:hypothetical protein